MGRCKSKASAWGRGCPQGGTGRSRVSAPTSPRCKASRGPGVRPSRHAGVRPRIKASALQRAGLNSLPCCCFGACAERHLPSPAFSYSLPLAGAAQPCPGPAAAQGPSGEPRSVFGCSPGSCVLAPGRGGPCLSRWLVLVRASTSQHLHLAWLQSACVGCEEGNKRDVKGFKSLPSEAARPSGFSSCPGVLGGRFGHGAFPLPSCG